MNYRHAFHAGNFADVHKHIVLFALLQQLHKKPTPFFFLDTHAGRGLYDLASEDALRSGEWRTGVGRLLDSGEPLPDIAAYLALIQRHHPSHVSTPEFYPGSPLIAAAMLRANDRAIFVEKNPTEAAALKVELGKLKRVSVVAEDGYAMLKAHLPPKENRGLVLIDPPYEADTEYTDLAKALQIALQRWPHGMYCLWYPIKADRAAQRLHQILVKAGIKKLLTLELNVRPADSMLGLNGSGLLIINPPWQLDTQMEALLPQLHRALVPDGSGGVRVKWLAGE